MGGGAPAAGGHRAPGLRGSAVPCVNELPEDRYEAFLSVPVLCRGRLVGVINVQHRQPREHTRAEIQLISTIGFLVGAEMELARLEVVTRE